jgi:hypothetical protein
MIPTIIYFIGFFLVPYIGIRCEKRWPDCLQMRKDEDGDRILYFVMGSMLWPFGLVMLYYFVLDYQLNNK